MFDISFRIKKTFTYFMARKIIFLNTFNIKSKFEECVSNFNSKEKDRSRSELDIKPLFRGLNKDDSQKVICMNQTPEVNIRKFDQANIEWIKNHKVNFSIMEKSF